MAYIIPEISGSHQRRTTVGRTPVDVWSFHRRDLYLTTHNTHKGQKSMPRIRTHPSVTGTGGQLMTRLKLAVIKRIWNHKRRRGKLIAIVTLFNVETSSIIFFLITQYTICIKWHAVENHKSIVIYILHHLWDLEKNIRLSLMIMFGLIKTCSVWNSNK